MKMTNTTSCSSWVITQGFKAARWAFMQAAATDLPDVEGTAARTGLPNDMRSSLQPLSCPI